MRYTSTLFSTVSLLVLCGSSYCQKLCAFSDTDMTKDRAERSTVGIQHPSVEGDGVSHLVLRIRDSNIIPTAQVPLIPDNTEMLSARENSRPSLALTVPSPASSIPSRSTMMPKDDVDKEVPQEMQHSPVLTEPEQHLKHQSELSVRMNLDSASQAFVWCRDQGNGALDRELVAHILRDKGWNDLAPEDQEWTVARVSEKFLHYSDLKVKMDLDRAAVSFVYCRTTGNGAPDRELVAHILRDKGWDDLAPEDQEWTIARVSEKFRHYSGLKVKMDLDGAAGSFIYCRTTGNGASDRELVAYLLRDREWADLTPESQEWTIAQVVTIANNLKKVTAIDMPAGRAVAGAAADNDGIPVNPQHLNLSE